MIGQTVSHYKILEKSRPKLHSGRGSSVFRFAKDENARSDISDRHAFRPPGGTGIDDGGIGGGRQHLRLSRPQAIP